MPRISRSVPRFVVALTGALMTLFGSAAAAPPAVAGPVHLASQVDLISGQFVPNVQPDGNTVVFHAPQGLVVVDTGRHPEHTEAILALARQAHAPIAAVINTHWHLDHVGGNAIVRQRYPAVRVYASGAIEDALRGFLADYRKQLQAMIEKTPDTESQKAWRAEIAIIDAGPTLLPDVRISATSERRIAGRSLEIGFEPRAVTAGDLFVFDKATGVLAAGDLVTLPVPFLDTACPSGWQAALAELDRVDFTTLVPGHGPPMKRKDFESYRAAFDGLLACAGSERSVDECAAGWATGASGLLSSEDPAFVRSLLRYYVGQLRGDPARIAKLCAS